MRNKILAYVALSLVVAQVLLMLASWLITAAMPDVFDRSLLSAEGIRWFFGRFQDNLASSLLVCLLLASIAWGALCRGGLRHYDATQYRQRIAMRLVVLELVFFLAVILLLTMLPHAILLNVMGALFPSSFSSSIIPYVCFVVAATSVSFGLMSGRLRSIEEVFRALTVGVAEMSPFFLLYVLAMQFYQSVLFLLSDKL